MHSHLWTPSSTPQWLKTQSLWFLSPPLYHFVLKCLDQGVDIVGSVMRRSAVVRSSVPLVFFAILAVRAGLSVEDSIA